MKCAKRRVLLASFCFSLTNTAWADCPSMGEDVLAALNCIPGVNAQESSGAPSGYRRFDLRVTQPVNHQDSQSQTFEQTVVLLHRDVKDPMVLQTSGYSIFGIGLSALARTFQTNQIQVEHRYFSSSTPSSRPLDFLNVQQSAADFHRIVAALKTLYGGPWVGTGASKGGMTSVYHRYFYPDDLTGTVADVAPLSFDLADERYIDFVDNVGGDEWKNCRADLERVQNQLLAHKAEILPRIAGAFEQLGSTEVGYEHAITELPYVFWQYKSPTDPSVGCHKIPSSTASASQLLTFMQWVNDASQYSDNQYEAFWPYYFQAGTELGGPAAKRSHLQNLAHDYSLAQYMPKDGKDASYSNALMRDVEKWVKEDAKHIMFVYGEYDPWTAGAFPQGQGEDMHHFVVARGNHGANFTHLKAQDRQEALRVLEGWFGRRPITGEPQDKGSLDELEFQKRRAARLP